MFKIDFENTIKQYESKYFDEWNAFISKAKKCELFHRDFIEYHSDRFQDYSLLILGETNCCIACKPS
jgi:hypothetical protein